MQHCRAELFSLVICGSLPTLKPVYDLLFSRKKKSSDSAGSKTLVSPQKPTIEKVLTEQSLTKQISQISTTTPQDWPLNTSRTSPVSPSSVYSASTGGRDDGGNVDELLSSIRAAVAAEQLRMEEDLRVHDRYSEDTGGGDAVKGVIQARENLS